MSLPDEIERVALLGWHLYPCVRSPSKAAMFAGAVDAATDNLDQLEDWSKKYPRANWRVMTGASRLFVIDLDVPGAGHKHDGVANFAELIKGYAPLPKRPVSKSGSGGLALFFRHEDERLIGESGKVGGGIDPLRGRQSMTIPPSIHHHTKQPYRWLVPPWEISPPSIPDWLASIFKDRPVIDVARHEIADDSRGRRILINAANAIRCAPSGNANNTLNKKAFYVARCVAGGLLSEVEATETLYAAAIDRQIPGREVIYTLKSAFRSGYARPLEKV